MSGVSDSARFAPRAIAVAASVGIGALLASSLPAALAAKDTTTVSTPAVTVEAAATPRVRRAERPAKAEGAPPPPAPSATAPPLATLAPAAPGEAVTRRHRAQGAEAPRAGGPAAPPASGGGSRQGDRHVPAAHSRGRAGGAGGAGGAATATGEASDGLAEGASTDAAATSRPASQGVEALARKQKKSGGGEKGGGKKRKEKERELKEREQKEHEHEGSAAGGEGTSGEEGGASGKGKPTSVGAEASPRAAAATASAPASATTPATAGAEAPLSGLVSSASAAQGLSAGGARAKHAARARRHVRGAAAKRASPTRTPALLGASLVPLAASGAGGSSSSSGTPARSGLGGSYARSSEPAIVHTITKIVNVVPGPVRILIAALAALALAFGLRSLLTGVRARRLARQRGELLEDVGLLQAALLPEPPARLGPVGTSVAYRPADGPGAGGDFYDVFALEAGQLAVIVGDVSGHGREALPHTALVRFTVRAYLEAGLEPATALQTAGAVLERQLGGSFATVLAAVYDPRERKLSYASAGHPPPLVLGEPDASGAARAIAPVTACSAPPLGAGMRTGTRQTIVSIPGAARLCFHTDGVTEARVGERREELFGAERLSRSLAELPAEAGAEQLLDSVAAQSSARPDDMAACLLHVHGAAAGTPAIVAERLELDREALADGERVLRFLEQAGVARAQAEASVERAARELERSRTATIELSYAAGHAPHVAVHGEVVIRAAALSAVGAS